MKKIVFCIVIIVLIFLGVYCAKRIIKNNNTVVETGAKTTNKGNNTIIENLVNEKELDEQKKNTENNEEKDKEENKTNAESPKEKAIRIVKENWGEDDTVYFFCENEENGKYPVAVRDKNTTKALYWYYVDIETGTFEIK